MLVARGFINGVYPSLSPQQTGPGQIINHAGMQTGFDKSTGQVQIFDQWKGQPLGDNKYDAKRDGWSVVLVPKEARQYTKQSNDLVPTAQLNPTSAHAVEENAIWKGLEKAAEINSNRLHGLNPKDR